MDFVPLFIIFILAVAAILTLTRTEPYYKPPKNPRRKYGDLSEQGRSLESKYSLFNKKRNG